VAADLYARDAARSGICNLRFVLGVSDRDVAAKCVVRSIGSSRIGYEARIHNWLPRARPNLHGCKISRGILVNAQAAVERGTGPINPRGKPLAGLELQPSWARIAEKHRGTHTERGGTHAPANCGPNIGRLGAQKPISPKGLLRDFAASGNDLGCSDRDDPI